MLAWARFGRHPALSDGLLTALTFGAFVGNNPHFHATNERLYRSRRSMMQYPLTAFVVPILLMGGVVASLGFPFDVAPYFIKLFLVWSPYHFAAQALGLSLIYARRAGIVVDAQERRALSWFLFATCILTWARLETGGVLEYYGIFSPRLALPSAALPISWIWTAITGCGFLWAITRWSRRGRVPWIVLFPVAVHFAWFVFGGWLPHFQPFTNFFHSIQYLYIAWAMRAQERGPAAMSALTFDSLKWFAINCAVGAGLFFGVPPLLARTPVGRDLSNQFIVGVFWSAYQIQHFFADAVIWKLKNPEVSQPLMGSVGELVRPAA
jgi:hypothetical protein